MVRAGRKREAMPSQLVFPRSTRTAARERPLPKRRKPIVNNRSSAGTKRIFEGIDFRLFSAKKQFVYELLQFEPSSCITHCQGYSAGPAIQHGSREQVVRVYMDQQ